MAPRRAESTLSSGIGGYAKELSTDASYLDEMVTASLDPVVGYR